MAVQKWIGVDLCDDCDEVFDKYEGEEALYKCPVCLGGDEKIEE